MARTRAALVVRRSAALVAAQRTRPGLAAHTPVALAALVAGMRPALVERTLASRRWAALVAAQRMRPGLAARTRAALAVLAARTPAGLVVRTRAALVALVARTLAALVARTLAAPARTRTALAVARQTRPWLAAHSSSAATVAHTFGVAPHTWAAAAALAAALASNRSSG